MNTVFNPFIISGKIPNAYFCDREAETVQLTNHIQNGRNVLLIAPRRVGKTGLIDHCFEQSCWESGYYCFSLDILQTSSLREFIYLFGKCVFETLKPKSRRMLDLFMQSVRSITGEFGFDVQTGLPKFSLSLGAIENPEVTLSEIFDYINKADKRCLVAIDEFQQITRFPEKNVEAILRSHIQKCSNANFIFAGSERHILSEMFTLPARPFYASTSMISLEEIPMEKYQDFVTEHFEEFDKTIDGDCVPFVYTLVGGNTYCLQKVFNVAYGMTPIGANCNKEMVQQAIRSVLLENERFYRNQLSLLSSKPKELLYAIAREGKAMKVTSGAFVKEHKLHSASSVQSATKQLLDADWITYSSSSDGQKQYSLTDPFLMLWLQQ